VDLRRQLAIARTWLPLLVASALIAGAAAYALSNLQHKVYEAETKMVVGQSLSSANPDYTQLLVSQQLSATYATVATTRPILDDVIKQLDLGVTTDALAQRVSAVAASGSPLLSVTAEDESPTQAAAIANAIADQLIAASPALQGRQAELQTTIDADIAATQDQINSTQAQVDQLSALPSPSPGTATTLMSLQDRLATLRSTYASLLASSSSNAASSLTIVEPAVVPASPISPRPLLYAIVAAIVALCAATGLVALVEYLDDSVADPAQVREAANLSTLGTIAQMRGSQGRSEIYRLVTMLDPHSGTAEAYRTLRSNIGFASVDATIQTMLVTSAVPREGKTVTAANIAVAFAQTGRRVLLVDADLRRPALHTMFNLPNVRGLTTVLRGDEQNLAAVVCATEQENLSVLTSGPLPPNPAELLGSHRMQAVLDRLKAAEELVIFDAPPLQAVTDAAVLSTFLDGALLVIRARKTRRNAVRQGRDVLDRAGAHVLGAVLNFLPARSQADYAGYYADYRSGRAEDDRRRSAKSVTGRSG
jgi:succinoglycan biosynthesis transport protein ExoP